MYTKAGRITPDQDNNHSSIEPFLEKTLADGLLTIYTPHNGLQYIV